MNPGRRAFSIALAGMGYMTTHGTWAQSAQEGSTIVGAARQSFRTSDGVTLSYLETAPPASGKSLTIVLVPGWCMPAAIWRSQLKALGARYRTLAFDPRGQGESEVPAGGYTAARRVADLHEFIETAVPRRSKVLLVGWSLAALESLQYIAMKGDGRLAGLALIDSSVGELPAPPGGNNSEGGFTQRLRSERERMLGEFIHAIFAKPRPPEEHQAMLQGALRIGLEDSIALLSYPYPREHWKKIAIAYKRPLLYAVTPQFAAQSENLKKNRPGTRTEVFRNAGHAMFADEPDRFNTLILDFARALR